MKFLLTKNRIRNILKSTDNVIIQGNKMKFFLEKTKNAGHRVTINIPKTVIDNTLIEEFNKINKKTNINGFRKGKAPIKIIQQKYGNSVYYDVLKKLMQKFFLKFLNEEKINIIGYPEYCIDKEEKQNEYFQYSVTYEVYPYFKIKKINSIKVENIIVNITDQDIKNNIIKDQKYQTIWKTVNRSIKINDRVTISYIVYEKNKIIEKFNIKNLMFIVNQNYLLNELNKKIINHYTNDIIFIKIFFSLFHPQEEFKNKNIIFKVKIIKIEEKENKKIDENIENVKFIESNWKIIKNKVIEDINGLTNNYLKNQIIKKLIQLHPIKIPSILLKKEQNFLHTQLIKKYQEKKGHILDKRYHINLEKKAKTNICAKLILEKIIKDNNIIVDDKKIESIIQKISEQYKKPLDIINIYKNNIIFQQTIKDEELKKEAMNLIKKTIKIIDKYYTFNEFFNYKVNAPEELFF